MIPSDHFTKFYNEVFKFLETQGDDALHAYWLEISKNQERHTLELFREKGLEGMRQYWDHIRVEENCDLDLDLNEDRLELRMNACPSLGKVMDNDAEPMARYCDHCAGWIGPIMDKLVKTTLFANLSGSNYLSHNLAVEDLKEDELPLSGL